MGTATYGPGDYGGYNDWAWSGANSFYTNWNTSLFSWGVNGTEIALAARYDYDNTVCTSALAHNDSWGSGGTRDTLTANFATNGSGHNASQTMNNLSTTTPVYCIGGTCAEYIGFNRDSSKCSIFSWKDNTGGGYAGKAGADDNNSGGTTNWGGTTNGGLPVYGTIQVLLIYVRRAGVWVNAFASVRRGGAWVTPTNVYVRRSGAWTIVMWLQEHGIPEKDLSVEVNLGKYWEPGYMIQGEKSWFGSVDPTTQSWDWTKEGQYEWDDSKPWTGKYNAAESEEIAEERLRAQYEWDKSLRLENYEAARQWNIKWQPPILTKELPILTKKPELEPEPILVGCNCG